MHLVNFHFLHWWFMNKNILFVWFLFTIVYSFVNANAQQRKSNTKRESDFRSLINKPKGDNANRIRLDGGYQNVTLRHLIDSDLYALRTILPYHGFLGPKHDTLHTGNMPDPQRIVAPVLFFNNGIVGISNVEWCDNFLTNKAQRDAVKPDIS